MSTPEQNASVDTSGKILPRGRRPPEDPDFYTSWAKENAKDFVKNANAALGQLLTLSTTLFGGAIAFWLNLPFGTPFKFLTLALLLSTAVICLFSAMPIQNQMDLSNPSDIRSHMEKLFTQKQQRLLIAKLTLLFSLLSMIIGLAAKFVIG